MFIATTETAESFENDILTPHAHTFIATRWSFRQIERSYTHTSCTHVHCNFNSFKYFVIQGTHTSCTYVHCNDVFTDITFITILTPHAHTFIATLEMPSNLLITALTPHAHTFIATV